MPELGSLQSNLWGSLADPPCWVSPGLPTTPPFPSALSTCRQRWPSSPPSVGACWRWQQPGMPHAQVRC